MNVGVAVVAPVKAATLPVGLLVRVHEYVSASPLASELPAPFRVTVEPVVTFCVLPALATGAVLVGCVVWEATGAGALIPEDALGEAAVADTGNPPPPPPPPQAARERSAAQASDCLVCFISKSF